ncbi:unnamed protein product [Closterium sp. NIES-53]
MPYALPRAPLLPCASHAPLPRALRDPAAPHDARYAARRTPPLRADAPHCPAALPTSCSTALPVRCPAAETSAYAVATSRGTPLPSFIEGCSPSLLAPSVASVAAVDFLGAKAVSAASTPSGRRNKGGRQKGKGGGGGSGGGGGGGGSGGGGGGSGGGGGGDGSGGGGEGGGSTRGWPRRLGWPGTRIALVVPRLQWSPIARALPTLMQKVSRFATTVALACAVRCISLATIASTGRLLVAPLLHLDFPPELPPENMAVPTLSLANCRRRDSSWRSQPTTISFVQVSKYRVS